MLALSFRPFYVVLLLFIKQDDKKISSLRFFTKVWLGFHLYEMNQVFLPQVIQRTIATANITSLSFYACKTIYLHLKTNKQTNTGIFVVIQRKSRKLQCKVCLNF